MSPVPFSRRVVAVFAMLGLAGSSVLAKESLPEAAPHAAASLLPTETQLDPAAVEQAARAALLTTVESFSDGRAVQVEVIDLRALPDSAATFALEGVGRLRVANSEWIPLRFLAGYDLVERGVYGLRVQPIASVARAANAVVDGGIGDRVNDQVAARILAEFPDQPLEVVFVDLQPISTSPTHIAFRGAGVVDFAQEGNAPVAFSAILDRASGLVIALDYSLEVAGAHGEGDPGVAARLASSH